MTEQAKKRKMTDGSTIAPSRDDLKLLLDPLSKDQLVSLLVEAGSQYPAFAEEIKGVASKDPAHRKLFVRGLAWETTTDALLDAFKEYGEIEEGAVIMDKAGSKSRGYGFITFKDMDSAQRALKEPSKTIDGRITVCNLASSGTSGNATVDQAQRKLYIGGLSFDTSSETVLSFFSQYGEIEEGSVAYDKNTNKSRGFAFVTFKTLEGTKRALEDSNKTIEGRHVTVKVAAEGQKERSAGHASAPQGHQVPTVQPGYSVVSPSLTGYSRQPVAPTQPAPLAYSVYSSTLGPYAAQPTYAAIPGTAQYGSVIPAVSQHYAQYPGGPVAGGLPPYYPGVA